MSFKIYCSYLFFLLISGISSLTISPSQLNDVLTVTLASSDWLVDSRFFIYINSSSCIQTDYLTIDSTNLINVTDLTLSNTCIKAILVSNMFISNSILLNTTATIKPGSMYTGYIVNSNDRIVNTSFMTSDSKSSAVSGLIVKSDFQISRLYMSWFDPEFSNGQIIQYNIWLENRQILWILTCIYCSSKKAGIQDALWFNSTNLDVRRLTYPKSSGGLVFNSNESKIIKNTFNVVSIVAVNGYGWGNKTSVSFISGSPIFMDSDISIAAAMTNSPLDPTGYQIPIIIPYSFISLTLDDIKTCTLIIVIKGRATIGTNQNKDTEQTYSQCNKGNDCSYYIILPLPTTAPRRKRDTPGKTQTYSNVPFIIGDNSYCFNYCNGPLNQNTEYQIGFRVCANSGCNIIIIQKRTAIDLVTVVVPIFLVILIPLIIILIVCQKKLKCKGRNEANNNNDNVNGARPSIIALSSAYHVNEYQEYPENQDPVYAEYGDVEENNTKSGNEVLAHSSRIGV